MAGELQKHYAQLLGIGSPWEVKAVELKLQEQQVEIELGWPWGAAAQCPECGRACSIHDGAPERAWRHLDTMQFTTLSRARTPRSQCPEHGVKTMAVPWAAPQGRFTLLFERLAVDVLLASGSVSQGCELLGIGWETAQEIMRRAAERGLERRQLEGLKHLGMDEQSFKRGQSYITLLTDLDQSRVLGRGRGAHGGGGRPVVGERSRRNKSRPWRRWPWTWGRPSSGRLKSRFPARTIVQDKFQVSKYLGEAVDKVRRQEHKELLAQRATRDPQGIAATVVV